MWWAATGNNTPWRVPGILPACTTGRIRLSVSTVNRTYELSRITHVTPFRKYGSHSTGLSTYGPWVRTYSKLFSCKSVPAVCSYRAQSNKICTYVSRWSLPRVRRYGFLYLRTVEDDHCHSTHTCIWIWPSDGLHVYFSNKQAEVSTGVKTYDTTVYEVWKHVAWSKHAVKLRQNVEHPTGWMSFAWHFLITVQTKINNCHPLPCDSCWNPNRKPIFSVCQYTALFCISYRHVLMVYNC